MTNPKKTSLPLSDGEKALISIDNQVCFQLYTASRLMTKQYQPVLKALDLTYPQYLVMLVLWEAADSGLKLTVSALGTRLFLDSGTLTPLIKRLENKGLIEKSRDPSDERQVFVGMTTKGLALSAKAPAVPQALMCEITETSIDTLIELRNQLKQLVDDLTQ
ncbi:Organic hydroperoxide resistance transcriptional regulator [BD1-7 clade bacterium]|uniref:Organic hydroperoxide resistance transcriptional regulator n=1 Tax=BD1-7 clade bacterium TaxID=2029982 RepID=A0A5S9PC92_9GAMM|nr:Organic hydroperoxide resistance transcriptional regulator [BD1-7 clade bacterium]CAA0102383.1 Organic hydroperoxide resistance transcriptional regulator [BD1-7 clade bacterium]